MRNNEWLENQMWELLHNHFADVPVTNEIIIRFGKRAYQRLGSIKQKCIRPGLKMGNVIIRQAEYDERSFITITGYFRDLLVPEYVVLATLAHELVHYAHGFSSPLEKKFEHPHKGKIVQRELLKRGLGDIHYDSEKWLKKEWKNYLKSVGAI